MKQYGLLPPHNLGYAEHLIDVVTQTDAENWNYFSQNSKQLAVELLDYGAFSRVICEREKGKVKAIGHIQIRLLKTTAPSLLYKDLYHKAGLDGIDLWELDREVSRNLPVYIDVIAIKKEAQHQQAVLELIPFALEEILKEIDRYSGTERHDILAVGVTDMGRKMCKMFGMRKMSEVERFEEGNKHLRTLYMADYSFRDKLQKMAEKVMKKYS